MALEHDTQVLAKQILEDLKPELVLSSPYSSSLNVIALKFYGIPVK